MGVTVSAEGQRPDDDGLGQPAHDAALQLTPIIRAHAGAIVADWAAFVAAQLPQDWPFDVEAFSVNAAALLEAICRDMDHPPPLQACDLRQPRPLGPDGADALAQAAREHGVMRHAAGHDVASVGAEFCGLRALILERWRRQASPSQLRAAALSTRLHDAIDRALAQSIAAYTNEADRVRLLFLGVVTHDLRSPLQAISLSSEILAQVDTDARARRAIETIGYATHRMTRLIEQLLDFSAVSLTGRLGLHLGETNLVEVCRAAIDEVVEGTGRTIGFRTCPTAGGCWDAQRLEQLVINLLGNAVEHGDPAAPVDVALGCEETQVTLSVHNGGSIDPAVMPFIFEPLRSGDPQGPRQRHAGLGLFIVKQVAMAHGGEIEVQSDPAHGTTFTLTLPR